MSVGAIARNEATTPGGYLGAAVAVDNSFCCCFCCWGERERGGADDDDDADADADADDACADVDDADADAGKYGDNDDMDNRLTRAANLALPTPASP